MSDEQVNELERYEESNAYTAQEKTVLRFTEQFTRRGKVEAAVMKELSASLSPSALVVLAAAVAQANWTNRFLESFEVELP